MANWTGPKFDVVIMDICDPIEAGPGSLHFRLFHRPCPNTSSHVVIVFTAIGPGIGLVFYTLKSAGSHSIPDPVKSHIRSHISRAVQEK